VTCLSGTFFGYAGYRAEPPPGARSLQLYPQEYLLHSARLAFWDNFAMEWKVHVGWTTPFLATAVAFVALRYRRRLVADPLVRKVMTIMLLIAFAGALVAATGLFLRAWARLRAARLGSALGAALAGDDRELIFERLAAVLEGAIGADWVGLVRFEEGGLGGMLAASRGEAPAEHALLSWLVRQAESPEDVLVAPARELSEQQGVYAALPLRRENSALVGFVVLRSRRALARHAHAALSRTLDAIGLALAERPKSDESPPAAAAAL
jgi:hypothetical protein